MSLVSLSYCAFLLVFLLLYYLLPKRFQWAVLLAASLVFYVCCATPWTFVYVFAAAGITYLAARRQLEASSPARGPWLAAGLLLDLGLLAALKYANFALQSASLVVRLFGRASPAWRVSWPAALGISFYTLQLVGYLLDCHWGIIKPEPSFGRFLLFACFFPQMTSGPISRMGQLGGELGREHALDRENLRSGTIRIIVGAAKKLILAENLAQIVPSLLTTEHGALGPIGFLGMMLYVAQVYADFSGCMDIVLGSAKLFGVTMVDNFRSPFLSQSIQEFWQRWHITLGLWLRDYVMYPLLRSRAFQRMTKNIKRRFGKTASRRLPTWLAMLALWLCMGLWHGGGWNFLLEGVWFWSVIVLGELLAPVFRKITGHWSRDNVIWAAVQRFRTMVIYAIGAILFRCPTVSGGLRMLWTIFSPRWIVNRQGVMAVWQNLSSTIGRQETFALFAAIGTGFILFCLNASLERRRGGLAAYLQRRPAMLQALVMAALVYLILLIGVYGPGYHASEFIYGGF